MYLHVYLYTFRHPLYLFIQTLILSASIHVYIRTVLTYTYEHSRMWLHLRVHTAACWILVFLTGRSMHFPGLLRAFLQRISMLRRVLSSSSSSFQPYTSARASPHVIMYPKGVHVHLFFFFFFFSTVPLC